MISLNVGEPHDNKSKRNLTLTRGFLHLPFYFIVSRHTRPLVEEEILIFPFLCGMFIAPLHVPLHLLC
jgi:hypothetical protein